MAEGHRNPSERPGLRPPAPHLDGPLGSSGAAPAEPTPQPAPEPAPESAEQPVVGPPVARPAAKTADQPVAEPIAQPAAKTADEPVAEPIAQPAAETATAPAGERSDPGAKPASTPTPAATASGDAKTAAESTSSATPAPAEQTAAEDKPEPDKATADKPGPEALASTPPGRSDADRNDAAEPDAAKPDAAKPDAAKPDAAEADPGKADPGKADGGKADGGKADPGKAGGAGPATAADAHIDLDKPVAASAPTGRVTRVLRHANPVRAARTAGRTTHAWSKRPTGRLVIPTVIAALLLGAAGTAGAYLVPQALEAAPSPSATPRFPLDAAAPGPSGAAALPSAPLPQNSAPVVPDVTGARPADALADWAQGVGTRVGIPVVAVQAYGYAELVAARTAPSCRLSWTTIAAIGKVESAHGSANGAVLGADGSVQPPVLGLPLDGKGGRQLIRDTDQGTLDGDTTFDRAMGPMQFIPATWKEMQVDADNSGFADPNDIDDAALAAALYLCRGGRDLSKADAWWEAILSYNAVQPYARKVFEAADEYGKRSRV